MTGSSPSMISLATTKQGYVVTLVGKLEAAAAAEWAQVCAGLQAYCTGNGILCAPQSGGLQISVPVAERESIDSDIRALISAFVSMFSGVVFFCVNLNKAE